MISVNSISCQQPGVEEGFGELLTIVREVHTLLTVLPT